MPHDLSRVHQAVGHPKVVDPVYMPDVTHCSRLNCQFNPVSAIHLRHVERLVGQSDHVGAVTCARHSRENPQADRGAKFPAGKTKNMLLNALADALCNDLGAFGVAVVA